MAVGWVPCASRLGQKRRIKTAISPPPPPQQRKKWSGGAASAGGRPLCVVRGFSDTALDSEARYGPGIVTRGTANVFPPSPPPTPFFSRNWTWLQMNFEHPQKAGNTQGTNAGAATSPDCAFRVIGGCGGTASYSHHVSRTADGNTRTTGGQVVIWPMASRCCAGCVRFLGWSEQSVWTPRYGLKKPNKKSSRSERNDCTPGLRVTMCASAWKHLPTIALKHLFRRIR